MQMNIQTLHIFKYLNFEFIQRLFPVNLFYIRTTIAI
jgi:hypothetical protein